MRLKSSKVGYNEQTFAPELTMELVFSLEVIDEIKAVGRNEAATIIGLEMLDMFADIRNRKCPL